MKIPFGLVAATFWLASMLSFLIGMPSAFFWTLLAVSGVALAFEVRSYIRHG